IATTMRSDNMALSTVQDSLGLGAAKVDTAYTGMKKAIDTVNEIKTKLVAATGSTGADKEKYQVEIKALQDQLKSYADSATFSGTNLLSVNTTTADAADLKIVSAFNRTAAGVASVSTIDLDADTIKLYDADTATAATTDKGILDVARTTAGARATGASGGTSVSDLALTASTTDAQIGEHVARVEEALKEMTTAATNLGAAKQRIDLQKTFTQSLMDSIDRGVGQLVDADMNKESTRLQALQVQQQLGIQALSIANGGSQSILSLFR
ncbi:MAG TPA: flagellin, partial [Mesorhizobium sp.]|nr:flagellin [Mesorhizobium sp.]